MTSGLPPHLPCKQVKAKVTKNKTAPPFREVTFDILFDRGIDSFGGLLDAAERCGVVARKGAWYFFAEKKLAQVGFRFGREAPPALEAGTPPQASTSTA